MVTAKILSSLGLVSTLMSASAASTPSLKGVDATLKKGFFDWMQLHGKDYPDAKDLLARMDIWLDNHAFIEQHNSKQPAPSYQLGHNYFSDMTLDEYQEYNKLGRHSPGMLMQDKVGRPKNYRMTEVDSVVSDQRRQLNVEELPDSVDWVAAGAVVPVKNQGMCGSCWAFSAICAIEGAHFVDTGSLVSLSEQELVDCDHLDLGCGGGLMDNAFLFDEDMPGICSEEDYPYAGHKHWIKGCDATKGLCDGVEHTRVKSFIDVNNTVEGLMEALVFQPVSVAIEADQRSFQLYKSGVYDDPECGNNLDHGVAAVGYGTSEEGVDYFVIRNSWGDVWGESGYIKLARQSDTVNGTCGVLSFASRPELRED